MTDNLQAGDQTSRMKLEMDGWYEIYNFGYRCTVFAKENHRLILDESECRVVEKYSIH